MECEREMSKEIIVCKNMDKTFETSRGAVHVIEDVTLNVHENELLVLFGPGQCGKSTMINCMSGLEPVTEGSVEVNGKKVIKPGPDRGIPANGTFSMAYCYGKCGIWPENARSAKERATREGTALY